MFKTIANQARNRLLGIQNFPGVSKKIKYLVIDCIRDWKKRENITENVNIKRTLKIKFQHLQKNIFYDGLFIFSFYGFTKLSEFIGTLKLKYNSLFLFTKYFWKF